jgi:hypothetical protein
MRTQQVGVDRIIRLDWLEQTVNIMLAGNDAKHIEAILKESLAASFPTASATTVRGSLAKTVTILMKTWVRVPVELESLRDQGLELMSKSPSSFHLPIHWGMVSAVYPFWSGVASQVGRLLRLQNNFTAAQVQRRIREHYGERETVTRRTRYVLRSFVAWGVLIETNRKGVYNPGLSLEVTDPNIVVWLIEAFLHSRSNKAVPLKDLLDNTGLFPFNLTKINAKVLMEKSPRLDILQHDLNDELVMLRNI